MVAIVWHRLDLRIEDNPALDAAVQSGMPILPLFIDFDVGTNSRWWLNKSLESLKQDYKNIGGHLCYRKGNPLEILKSLDAKAIYWNQSFDPSKILEDQLLEKQLGIPIFKFNGNHLIRPDEITTQTGKPYSVFSPFWKSVQKIYENTPPLSAPHRVTGHQYPSDPLQAVDAPHLDTHWKPGRAGALEKLKIFQPKACLYETMRDFPGRAGTSQLSPHLHFGEISPKEIWHALPSSDAFLRQLAWREFATYFLYHFPHIETKNWNEKFNKFPWKNNPEALRQWQKGMTGYPIVDAGMRELLETGWMHNRVRMIVASFLIKDLLIDWREGAKWFRKHLVDADTANNTLGWQWVAGSGPDPAPFFRIFNPILQGEKFDPDGEYVKMYVPELKDVPAKWIHKPWQMPDPVAYQQPIVDHSKARNLALEAFDKIK